MDGDVRHNSESSIPGELVGMVAPGRSGRLSGEDECQGNAFDEEVITSMRGSNASPISSPVAISLALPFQMTDFDSGLISDVEAARCAAMCDMEVMKGKTSYPVSLKFLDLRYSVRVKTLSKEILHGVTGWVAPGEMLAMMGSSGSGKTTLLNVLGGRASGILQGTIAYNDRPYNKHLKSRIGFVTQEDILYPHLTVRETLSYAALLRLPKAFTKREKLQRAEEVIQQLRLDRCRDTIVGNGLLRGVSGGERKRVCIGHEILIDPSLIFLDEPTSGLDSTTALHIIQLLQAIAIQGGRTVVTTIHQPSTRMFHIFDKLILLSDGSPIYFGKTAEALIYFSSIGFKSLTPMNPAELLLDLSNGNASNVSVPCFFEQTPLEKEGPLTMPSAEDVKQYLIKICDKEILHKEGLSLLTVLEKEELKGSTKQKREWATTWWEQFLVLLMRGFKERRHEYLSSLRVGQVVATSIICGLLWWQSKSKTLIQLQDQVGLVFFIALFWSFIPCSAAIFTFPLERAILAKERASDMYRLSAYFTARTLSDLPLDLILPTIFVTIVYFMAHLRMTPRAFLFTLLAVFLVVITAQSLGLLIGAAITDVKKAATLSSVLVATFMLCGGFFLHELPPFLTWMKYLSFHRYAYKLLIKVQYDCFASAACEFMRSSNVIHGIRLSGGGGDVMALVMMVVGYRSLAFIALLRMKAG